ncbi:MAG: hypothetical protein Q7S01_01100 [bacterium]|nr:hypothetical protein [bacterium]
MKNSQQGFAPLLLLAIIALLAIGGGAYVYLQKKQVNLPEVIKTPAQANPIPQTLPPQNPVSDANNVTANWETYTSTKDGYSFRYPEEWNIGDGGIFSKQGVPSSRNGFFGAFYASDLYVLIHSPESANSTRRASPQEVMSDDYPSNRGVKKEEWLHINNIPVLYYDTTSDTIPDGPNGDIRFVIFTAEKQYVFVLSPGNKVSPTSFVPEDTNTMKKIISTFSLLNSFDKFVDMTSIPLSTFQLKTTPYQPYQQTQ